MEVTPYTLHNHYSKKSHVRRGWGSKTAVQFQLNVHSLKSITKKTSEKSNEKMKKQGPNNWHKFCLRALDNTFFDINESERLSSRRNFA